MHHPTPTQIKAARRKAGLTQTEAAKLIYRSLRGWQDWEGGINKMPPGDWELFQRKLKRGIV